MLDEIRELAAGSGDREGRCLEVADAIRRARPYRWVGLYDVDGREVAIVAWSGGGPPAHPTFSATQGLTSAAIADRVTVVSNDVAADPRYLDAFGDTASEMIVPVLGADGAVAGTIDVESDRTNAFTDDDRDFVEACAAAARALWLPA